jgi:hypothetical protein
VSDRKQDQPNDCDTYDYLDEAETRVTTPISAVPLYSMKWPQSGQTQTPQGHSLPLLAKGHVRHL